LRRASERNSRARFRSSRPSSRTRRGTGRSFTKLAGREGSSARGAEAAETTSSRATSCSLHCVSPEVTASQAGVLGRDSTLSAAVLGAGQGHRVHERPLAGPRALPRRREDPAGNQRRGPRPAGRRDVALILHPLFKCPKTKNSGIPKVCDTGAPGPPAPPERGRCVDPQRESGTAPGAPPARRAGCPRESGDG
jgi:hypothetical protein